MNPPFRTADLQYWNALGDAAQVAMCLPPTVPICYSTPRKHSKHMT